MQGEIIREITPWGTKNCTCFFSIIILFSAININGPKSYTIGQDVSLNCSLNYTDVGIPLHIDWKVPDELQMQVRYVMCTTNA